VNPDGAATWAIFRSPFHFEQEKLWLAQNQNQKKFEHRG